MTIPMLSDIVANGYTIITDPEDLPAELCAKYKEADFYSDSYHYVIVYGEGNNIIYDACAPIGGWWHIQGMMEAVGIPYFKPETSG